MVKKNGGINGVVCWAVLRCDKLCRGKVCFSVVQFDVCDEQWNCLSYGGIKNSKQFLPYSVELISSESALPLTWRLIAVSWVRLSIGAFTRIKRLNKMNNDKSRHFVNQSIVLMSGGWPGGQSTSVIYMIWTERHRNSLFSIFEIIKCSVMIVPKIKLKGKKTTNWLRERRRESKLEILITTKREVDFDMTELGCSKFLTESSISNCSFFVQSTRLSNKNCP